MIIKVAGTVIDVVDGKKSTYVQMNDAEQGGMLKLGFPLGFEAKLNSQVDFEAEVKPQIGSYGLSLNVVKILKKGDK
jgi:hypothetical protein